MSLELRFRPEVEADVREAQLWYDARSHGLGDRFNREVQLALARVAERPLAWGQAAPGVRRIKLSIFPYLVVYRVHDSFIEVIAIVHGARHARLWLDRIEGA